MRYEQYHLTVPVALLSPIAKILGVTKLRAGALTRRAGALSLRKAVRPSSVAAGLKLNREFMKSRKLLWTAFALQHIFAVQQAAAGDQQRPSKYFWIGFVTLSQLLVTHRQTDRQPNRQKEQI